ncbi:hypothetical protein WJX82_006667 [Trebouxia sp. C0006]
MFAVLTGSNQMSTPLENLEQQYAAEVVKVNADEGLLKRLERGIRGLKGVAESTDTQNDAAWRSEVTESLKALLNQPSKAMVPQAFSRVGSTQANRVLASLEIVETVGNVLDPIVVNEPAPASRDFDFSEYVNEYAGTLDLLKHHQVELIKFGVKFGRDAFTMYDLHDHQNLFPIVHDGQEYHGGLDGGVAPHCLSIASAANQLRVAYEHKQSSAQKQRYREYHGDKAQGQKTAGPLMYSGSEKGQSVIASLGAYAYNAWPLLLDLTDGESEVLLSSATLVDRKLKMTSNPDDLQRPLKKLRALQVDSGLLEQLNGIVPDLPCEERLAASYELISTWAHLQPIMLPPPLQKFLRDDSAPSLWIEGPGGPQLLTKRLDSGPLRGLTVELAGLNPEHGSLCKTVHQLANAREPILLSCGLPELYIDDIKARADRTGPAANGSVVLSQELSARLDTLPEDSQAVSHLFKQGRLPVPYGNLEALEDMTKELVVGSSGKLAEFFSDKIRNGGLLDATGKNEEATWSAFTSSLQTGRLQTAKSFEDVQAAYAVANQCSAMVSTAEARETPTLHGPVAKFRNDKDMVLQKEKYLKVVLSRLGWSRHPSSLTVEDVCKVIRADGSNPALEGPSGAASLDP